MFYFMILLTVVTVKCCHQVKLTLPLYIGTFGYLAKKHLVNLTITDRTDVYSFGMVLLEVVRGGNYLKMEEEFWDEPIEERIQISKARLLRSVGKYS